jgi:hypothetical protein
MLRPHRFGRRLELRATIAIKHQIRKLTFEDAIRQAIAELSQLSGKTANRPDHLRSAAEADECERIANEMHYAPAKAQMLEIARHWRELG